MKPLDIRIGNQRVTLACEEGQEVHVTQLAAEIDMRARGIKEKMPRASEHIVLVMTALMLADELYESRQEAGMLHEKLAMGAPITIGSEEEGGMLPSGGQAAHHLAYALNDIAEQIEAIANAVERR